MPKISLIIPTRNGESYIWASVKTILAQSYSDMELIVSVNHSTDNTLELLRQFQDPRLRVIAPPRLLSMTSHYEWCLQQAMGDWVTIIGDDDGVMPYFFYEFEELLSRCGNKKVDAFIFRRAYYFWPGCEDIYGKQAMNVCAVMTEQKVLPKLLILRAILFDLDFNCLPTIYTNNLVRRTLVEKIRSASGGKFYNELNPDVYSGVAVALKAREIVRSEFPLFWTGTSPKSVNVSLSKSNNLNGKSEVKSNEQTETPINEFFKLASNDDISVASEFGINAWRDLRSSSVWVVSALFMIPFKKPWLMRKRMLLVLAACLNTSASLWQEHDRNVICRKKFLLYSVIKKNGISRNLFFTLSLLVAPIFRAMFMVKRIVLKVLYINRRSFSLSSDSHSEFPDLLKASLAVENEYNNFKTYQK